MAQVIKTNEWGRVDVYEVVNEVPTGFYIWNIGHHAPAGYVPLCESLPDKEWCVNTKTLKAIKSDHAREILLAAGAGGVTLEKRRENANSDDAWLRKRCSKALPYMEELIWN